MSDAALVVVGEHPLRCHHCGHDEFGSETVTLDRMGLGFLQFGGLLWGRRATVYGCARCGFLHLFSQVEGAEHRVLPAAAQAGR